MPVRIYAFAKDLGFDNKQLLDICESAGIKGKGSALASLSDDEIATINAFLAGPPPEQEVEEVQSPVDEIEEVEEAEVPVQEEAAAIVEEDNPPSTPAVEALDDEPVANDELAIDDDPVVDEAIVSSDEASEDSDPETPAPGGVAGAVGGLLNKLRNKSRQPFASVKATTGTPAVKKASIRDKAVAKEEPVAKAAPKAKAPVDKPAAPKVPKTPMRSPLFNRGNKAVRDLDSRPKSAADDAAKKDKPVKKRGVTANIAAMPTVKQPSASTKVEGEKVQKPDIALPQDAISQIQRGGGAAPLEHLTKTSKKGKKKGKDEGGTEGETVSKVRRSSKRVEDTPLGGLRNRRPPRPGRPGQYGGRYGTRRSKGKAANTAAPRKDDVVLQLPCTVREFSEAAGVPAVQALLTIQQLGDTSASNINSSIPSEMVELLIEHFQSSVEVREAVSAEDELMAKFEQSEENEEDLVARAPIVTFLGHVDHGKTSLLDALIGIDVVSGEAGGITQHIRAYEVKKDGQKIAFVDTPGHEAFTEMRARGANVTDIAILVVAADDGIMPQTEEAITHAKAAGVPIIVALNKIDIPGITADKALQDLATAELLPSEWGGETEVVRTSAIAGTGLDELLETILVTAELHEYKANPNSPAFGTCLESEQQSDRGVVCKVMVQGGTLNVGDIVVCGPSYGRVKAMHDTLKPSRRLKSAGPSTPVNLTGFNTPPGAGDKLYVVEDVATARDIAEKRLDEQHEEEVSGTVKISLEEMQRRLEAGTLVAADAEVVTLNLIIRADTKGSIEAIKKELGKIDHPEVRIKVIQALVGGVSVADVRLAQASEAVICAFNVVPDETARSLADEVQAEIRRYEVIYKITDDLKAMLEGRLKPEEQIVEQGMAMVLQTFSISKTGTIAGCRVMRGNIKRECRIRVIRDSTVIGDYQIDTLKREKDDAKEVQRGMECGIKLSGFNDIKEGDTLEAYVIEEVARTL